MKKNLLRKVTALGLAMTMLFSVSAQAAITGNGSASVTATSQLVSAPINVIVPTTMVMQLDPQSTLKLPLSGRSHFAQISSPTYAVLNMSAAPVKLDIEAFTTSTTGNFTSIDDARYWGNGKGKNLYLELVAASKVGVDNMGALNAAPSYLPSVATLAGSQTGSITMATSAAAADASLGQAYNYVSVPVRKGTATTANAKMTFLLDSAKNNGTEQAANQTGVAGFKFQGTMNANAPWLANDFSTTVKFTVTATSPDAYLALAGGKISYNFISVKGSVLGHIEQPSAGTASSVTSN